MRCVIHATFVALITLCFPPLVHAQTAQPSWQQAGETLSYDISWLGLNAGQAEIKLLPISSDSFTPPVLETDLEKQVNLPLITAESTFTTPFHLIIRAWSNTGIESLFKMRDRLSVYGYHHREKGQFIPHLFRQIQYENDSHRDKILLTEPNLTKAGYIARKYAPTPEKWFDVTAATRDILTGLYTLRAKYPKPEVGKTYTLPAQYLDDTGTFEVRVSDKTTIKTAFGRRSAYEITPRFVVSDKAEKPQDNLKIYVSTDGNLLPYEIQLKAPFGTFKATLKEASVADTTPSKKYRSPKDLPLYGTFKPAYQVPAHANPVD